MINHHAHELPDQLLARAALWRWAARAFWYPETDFLVDLRDPVLRRELISASAAAGDCSALTTALSSFWQAADDLGDAALSLPQEHTALFARQVVVSPHAMSYAPKLGPDRAQGIAELASFYAAFGFQVSATRPELPDHLSTECEFVAVLLAKEAYAVGQGWADRARLTLRARRKFVRQHVASRLPSFAERLGQHRRLPFYPSVAALVLALLELEAKHPGPSRTGLPVPSSRTKQR